MRRGRNDAEPSLIELRGATVLFRGKPLFPRTWWAIRPGEHWAVVGPNGSGKSALALALRGDLPIVDGDIVRSGGCSERDIAHVTFEDQRALVASWCRYLQGRYESAGADGAPDGAALLGLRRGRKAVQRADASALLGRLGLLGLLDRPAPLLSNGEARKLLIAKALLDRPRILILEDPLVGLDRASRIEIRRVLRGIARLGITLVLVVSRLEDAIPPVNMVLLVKGGRIVSRCTRRDLPAASRRAPGRAPVQGMPLPPADRRRLPAGEPLVEMRGVTVDYGNIRVLDGVDWTIRSGEHWALLGPNGSGKTTLLSLILADNPQAYANDVRVLGRQRGDGVTIWDIKATCGHVSPEVQIHHVRGTGVLEVIASGFFDSVGLYRSPSPAQVRAACAWGRALGLGKALDREYASLSEGERRLALIARALVKRPLLLVLDEPCLGLDEAHRARVLSIVERLGRDGRCSIIYVTHDADEIPACMARVLRLERGRVVRNGGLRRRAATP